MFLLMFLVHKVGTLSCPASDAFLVPHEWYQPGDFIIGGMASHFLFHFIECKFKTNPSITPYDISIILGNYMLHSFLQGISFNNSAGEIVFLNEKGEAKGGFDISNLITFPNRSFQRVRIGKMDLQAPKGKQLFIDEDMIAWNPAFNQIWMTVLNVQKIIIPIKKRMDVS
ncbi:hypothetical protein E2320_003550 [Naja naja]|nr:hypothetical protein E2320_003550 [Naja naja]